jgi:hypothetical protein
MKVAVEKREIVGTLKSLLGTYPMLESKYSNLYELFTFSVVDDEGFASKVVLHGDFVIVPLVFPKSVDVKRVLTEQEAQEVQILDAATID